MKVHPFLFLLFLSGLALTSCQQQSQSDGADQASDRSEAAATATDEENTVAVDRAPQTGSPEVTSIRRGSVEFSPAEQYISAKLGTKEVEFVYTAVNLGDKPVKILEVDAGCACIEESADPMVIPPGGSSRISAIYSTEKVGHLAEKKLYLRTDEPGTREAILLVKLEMEQIYKIDNSLTTWAKGKKADTKVVNFEVTRPEPIHLLSATSSRSEVKAELKELEKGKKYQILLTPESTGSNLLGMVRLETDCEIEAHARPLLYMTIQ